MSITRPQTPPIRDGLIPSQLPQDEVLFEGEVPVIYTSQTSFGQPLLAYLADETSEGVFTLLASIGLNTVSDMKAGLLSVRDALSAGFTWLHWSDGEQSSVWKIELSELPKGHLPKESFRLSREHEIVFSTRALGEQIAPGKIPASVVAFVAENTRRAFKTILDLKFARSQDGRPSDAHRAIYDLPVQSFRFASFELDFAAPEAQLFIDDVRNAAQLLEVGLAWASGRPGAFLPADPDEREAVLRATYLLTPPSFGPISQIEIGGRWLKHEGLTLERGSRKRVSEELRTVDMDSVQIYSGLLEELDLGRFSCTLRRTADGIERKAYFSEEMSDAVQALLNRDVTMAGTERKGRFELSLINLQNPDPH